MGRVYAQEDFPDWYEIVDQSSNFIFVRIKHQVYTYHLEELLDLVLVSCGISAAGLDGVTLALRKE